jgi:hypothetical protein
LLRKGAFYVLANISRLGLSSPNFADRMLSKHHVAVVPGIAFGNDGTVRLSYATEPRYHQKGVGSLRGVLPDAVVGCGSLLSFSKGRCLGSAFFLWAGGDLFFVSRGAEKSSTRSLSGEARPD